MKENQKDKFKAVWLSHSSISDYLKCPRLYYLRNVFKDPKTKRKMTVMTPPLALGQAVHSVIENLSTLPVESRFSKKLSDYLNDEWVNVTGKKGGFTNPEIEAEYKKRALAMLDRIEKNPGPLAKKAIKIKSESGLPYYWYSEKENIILCGKIDWIEYLPKNNSIHIIDFKTGKNTEDDSSLQLPIYLLLSQNTQNREIKKASYWYLENDKGLTPKDLPDAKEAYESVYTIAMRIKLARNINHFVCPKGGCMFCEPLERVLKNEGEKVGISEYNQDIFILPKK